MRVCYYELLGVEKDSSNGDIKKAYYKAALKWHPDKNANDPNVVAKFQDIQNAYQVLSDSVSRKWYDEHQQEHVNQGEASEFEVDVFKYVWTEKDGIAAFYAVYQAAFDEIIKVEGEGDSGFTDVTMEDLLGFYSTWKCFQSKRNFSWYDQYDVTEAPNRTIRRLMEKDNKILRQEGKKKYIQKVREFVNFVYHRDPRMKQHLKDKRIASELKIMEMKKQKELAAKQYAIDKAEFRKKQQEHWQMQELERMNLNPKDRSTRIADEEEALALEKLKIRMEKVPMYCTPCKKAFKSEKQLKNHLQSKKHADVVKDLPIDEQPRFEDICNIVQECPMENKSSCNVDTDSCENIDMDTTQAESNTTRVDQIHNDTEVPNTKATTKSKAKLDPQVKLAKEQAAAAKRLARKEKRKCKKSQVDVVHKEQLECFTCGLPFLSRNALFKHIKKTGHESIPM